MTESGIADLPIHITRGCYGSYEADIVSGDRLKCDSLGSHCPESASVFDKAKLPCRFSIHDSPAAALRAFAAELAKIPEADQWTALSRFRSGRHGSLKDAQENRVVHYCEETTTATTVADILADNEKVYPETRELFETHNPTLWVRPQPDAQVEGLVTGVVPAGVRPRVIWEPK